MPWNCSLEKADDLKFRIWIEFVLSYCYGYQEALGA